jgi:uncharacterized protein (DUF342 family)
MPDIATSPSAVKKQPIRVLVSHDQMKAEVVLPAEEGYTADEIRAALHDARVVHGIDEEMLSSLSGFGGNTEPFVIANGTPPGQSVDGYLEYLYAHQSTDDRRNGRIDWRELNLIISVEPGDKLARKTHPVYGEPGHNVRGQKVEARRPQDPPMHPGNGTAFAADDHDLLVATHSGAVRIDEIGRLLVDPTYVVSGDVDMNTGNVRFTGSVMIAGDVKKGFTVEATGDVQVNGIVEEAAVTAGGSVVAKGAILGGSQNTPVKANEDIVARFANNAVLNAGRDVQLQQEAVNCEIVAQGRVLVGGVRPSRGAILGGTIRACDDIVVYNVGAAGGARTKLRSGADWLAPGKIQEIDDQLADCADQEKKVVEGIQGMKALEARGQLDELKRELLGKLLHAQHSLRVTVHELKSKRETLVKRAQLKSSITVWGTAHAGTELIVDGKSRVLVDSRTRERFVVEGGAVIGVPARDDA